MRLLNRISILGQGFVIRADTLKTAVKQLPLSADVCTAVSGGWGG